MNKHVREMNIDRHVAISHMILIDSVYLLPTEIISTHNKQIPQKSMHHIIFLLYFSFFSVNATKTTVKFTKFKEKKS